MSKKKEVIMKLKDEKTFFDLLKTPSPSGFEKQAQNIWKEYLDKKGVKLIESDVNGNAFACCHSKMPVRNNSKILLMGHCDEIGLMVKYINDGGFIYVAQIGGADNAIFVGQRVTIKSKKGELKGIIGRKPIHLLETAELRAKIKTSEIYIDIGVKDKKEAQKIIEIGDSIVVDVEPFYLHKKRYICSRGLDNKISSFIIARIISELDKLKGIQNEVWGCSSSMEEIGGMGASTGTYYNDPDIAINLDVTFSSDAPGLSKEKIGEIDLGKGPVISRGSVINHRLFDELVKVAKKYKIPYQVAAESGWTGTNMDSMKITKKGMATGLISLPNRYMHTPVEVCAVNDIENTIKLLVEFCKIRHNKIDFI